MKKTYFFGLLFTFLISLSSCSNGDEPILQGSARPEGFESTPFYVSDALSNQGVSRYLSGYIVGYIVYTNEFKYVFNTDTCTQTGTLLLADRANEIDPTKCIAIQLPKGKLQDSLNLKSNKRLGEKLTVYGSLEYFYGKTGLKNASYAKLANGTILGTKPSLGDFSGPEMKIDSLRKKWKGTQTILTDTAKIAGVVITDLAGGNSGSLRNLTITALNNSAGVMVRLNSNNTYKMGDVIEIDLRGMELNHYGLAIQLTNIPVEKTRKIGTATIVPRSTTIAELKANLAKWESTLATVRGTVESGGGGTWYSGSAGGQNNKFKSGTDELTLYVTKYAAFKSSPTPTGEKSVTGVVGQFNGTVQMIVRNLDDIKD
jgi:hypothetical protein